MPIMTQSFLICLVILFLLSIFTLPAKSQPSNWQSLDVIQQTAKNFLEDLQSPADNPNTKVIVSSIDPRTRLIACNGSLQAFLAPGMRTTGKTTVGVKCNGNANWKLFLPANVEKFEWVWVANRNLHKTDVISESDLVKKQISTSRIRKSPLQNIAKIVNTSPKRRINAGSVIFADSVCLVCRGQTVNVVASNEYLSIGVEGVAMADAALGETAKVRNSRSKRVFNAIVTGKNQLKVSIANSGK